MFTYIGVYNKVHYVVVNDNTLIGINWYRLNSNKTYITIIHYKTQFNY